MRSDAENIGIEKALIPLSLAAEWISFANFLAIFEIWKLQVIRMYNSVSVNL